MSEHTPGPWAIPSPQWGFTAINGPAGELIFGLAAGGAAEKQPDAICEANARLIAAAPELLDALKDCLCELSPLMNAHRPDHAETICGKARAAIAKATETGQ